MIKDLGLSDTLTIRPALLADAPAVFAAHQDSVLKLCKDSYSAQQMAIWFEDRTHEVHHPAIEAGQVVLAEDQGRVLGFFGFVPGEITLLFVRPEAVGTGLSGRLLALAIDRARVGHAGPLTVLATRNARRFYEKHGFSVVAQTFFERGAAQVRFEVLEMQRPAPA